MKPTLLFWCQHSVGLGHLTRAHALCAKLVERFRVVLVCGGPLPDGIVPPAGVELVALPPLGVGAAGTFVSHDPRLSVTEAWAARRELILATYDSVRPSVVLVELWPFGRAKFGRELLPLLEAARRDAVPVLASVRDILVSRRDDQRAHDERACALANEHLDGVLVHSDPRFARFEHTFGAAAAAPGPGTPHGLRRRRPAGAERRAGRRAGRLGRRRARRRAAAARGARRAADPVAADRTADAHDRRPLPPRARPGTRSPPRRRPCPVPRSFPAFRRSAPSSSAPRRRSASAATTRRSS